MSDPAEPTVPAGEPERDRGVIRAVADPAVLADRRQRQAELAEREARRRAGEAEAANRESTVLVGRLEVELGTARRESERLRTELERAERQRLEAEQLAHSERAMRLDLGHDHAARIRRHQADARAVLELLDAAQIHARDLGREIETLRRSAAEPGDPPSPRDSDRRSRILAVELAIAASIPPAPAARALPGSGVPPGLALELAMRAMRARNARSPTRGNERGARSPGAESRLAGALLHLAAERADGDAHVRGEDQDGVRAAYVSEAIEAIARQLNAVRAVVALLPPVAGEEAERVSPSALPPSAARSDPPAEPAGVVAPDRLAAALYRLREGSSPPESAPDAPGSPSGVPRPAVAATLAAELAVARAAPPPAEPPPAPLALADAAPDREPAAPRPQSSRWLLRALKTLLREDPAVVGNLVIRLVPAQRLVVAGPVSYDIALSGSGSLAVTVRDDAIRLDVLSTPRSLDEVDFRIEGDLGALGRLLVYGSLRRRFSRRVARIRGDRRAFGALDWLVREPLGLRELYTAGLRLDPELTLRLVAHMIDASWTAGERFTIGHEAPGSDGRVYLFVRDGARPRVSRQPPLGPVATTIRCPDEQLLALLSGGSGIESVRRGSARPIALLCDWIARAQRVS